MKLTVPNDIFMDEVRGLLAEGFEVTLRAKGRSMHPYIRDGRDMLVLRPIQPQEMRKGEVVLARTTRGHYAVHRIVAVGADTLTLRGDGNLAGTETVMKHEVMALLTHIERDGRLIDCRSLPQRMLALAIRLCWRTPRLIKRRLHHIITRQ